MAGLRALETLIRLRREALDGRRRALGDLESRRAALDREAAALEARLVCEQETARAAPEALYAYQAFARRVIAERAGLQQAGRALDDRIAAAREDLRVAFGELKKFEIAHDQRVAAERRAEERAAQKVLDEIAVETFRRGARAQ